MKHEEKNVELATAGHVEWIHTAPGYGEPVVTRERVVGTPGRGLDGDRYGQLSTDETPPSGRLRGDVTLIEAETVEDVAEKLGLPIAPGELRRNVTTRGVRLNDLVGRRFRIGGVVCQGIEPSDPCAYLQRTVGKPVLKPLVRRGGLRAAILVAGEIRVGDRIVAE